MTDSRTVIRGNLIYKSDNTDIKTRFESSKDLKNIISKLHDGTHTGDIELDGSSVIVFNGIKKSSLINLVESLETGAIYETYYTKEVI